MDSLIYLDKWCPSLPIILKLFVINRVVGLIVVMLNGWGILHVLFLSFTKGPGGFPYVLIITAKVTTLIPIDGITLVDHRAFVLGETRRFLMVLPPLK